MEHVCPHCLAYWLSYRTYFYICITLNHSNMIRTSLLFNNTCSPMDAQTWHQICSTLSLSSELFWGGFEVYLYLVKLRVTEIMQPPGLVLCTGEIGERVMLKNYIPAWKLLLTFKLLNNFSSHTHTHMLLRNVTCQSCWQTHMRAAAVALISLTADRQSRGSRVRWERELMLLDEVMSHPELFIYQPAAGRLCLTCHVWMPSFLRVSEMLKIKKCTRL